MPIPAGRNLNVPCRLETPDGVARYEWWYASPRPISPIKCPGIPERINTIFGGAAVIGGKGNGVLADLDNNPFSYRPAALYAKDLWLDGGW